MGRRGLLALPHCFAFGLLLLDLLLSEWGHPVPQRFLQSIGTRVIQVLEDLLDLLHSLYP